MAQAGNHVQIARMTPGQFWCRGRSLDLSEEDRQAINDGSATEEHLKRFAAAFETARERMIDLPPGVPLGACVLDHVNNRYQ